MVLMDVKGGTLRARGAMMAVTAHSSEGYISNGCVDADIIMRARSGQSGCFIYGEGSPYLDITLPCGGRLDVAIYQNLDLTGLEVALADLLNRHETSLDMGDAILQIKPKLRLRIAGRGAACLALAQLAEVTGLAVLVQSPEAGLFKNMEHLIDPSNPPVLSDDSRTAMVCLFHDHDWEAGLLSQALEGPAFYVGAMGSQRTHDHRCQVLLQHGLAQKQIERIKGPIGLIPAQRNTQFLAISILAEILQVAQAEDLL